MRLKILLPLLILIMSPLAILGWLGLRVNAEQKAEIEARFEAVVAGRLNSRTQEIGRAMSELQRRLDAHLVSVEKGRADPRKILRGSAFPYLLRFDAQGRLEFPPLAGPTSAAERRFLTRTESLWRDGWSLVEDEDTDRSTPSRGWRVWYWGGGLNLLYWSRTAGGEVAAVEVNRARLLDWVLRSLPSFEASDAEARVVLLDAAGRALYQWGRFEPPPGMEPLLSRQLAHPLSGWRLTWQGTPPPVEGVTYSLFLGLAALGVAFVGLAIYVYRVSGAEVRRATQRVSFVNQVSHELKTPLTNIRMYAELLDEALEDPPPGSARFLRVIVDESKRLSRLIANVLSFARDQRDGLTLRRTEATVDQVVETVVATFAPSFQRANIAVELTLDAPALVLCDRDAIEQIVGNLLSNVEKYAAQGGQLRLKTAADEGWTTIDVQDSGQGIPLAQREKVFTPFHRLSDALVDGVTGTGIGLGIARRLARLHGGDLRLEPSTEGAHFRVRLRTERRS